MKTAAILVLSTFIFILSGCGCKNESPSLILENNGSAKASIQIKTSNGNTENHQQC